MKRIRYVLVALFAAAAVAIAAMGAIARPAQAEEATFVPVTFIEKAWMKNGQELTDAEILKLVNADLIPSEITLLVTDNTADYKQAFKSTEVNPEDETDVTEVTCTLDEETALNKGWEYVEDVEAAFEMADDAYKPALRASGNFITQIRDSHNDVEHCYAVELEHIDESYEFVQKGEITSKKLTYGEIREDAELLGKLDEDTQNVINAKHTVEGEETYLYADDSESFVTVVTVENTYTGEIPADEIPAATPQFYSIYGAPASALAAASTPTTTAPATKNVSVNAIFANTQNQQFSVPASIITVQLTANGADVSGKVVTLNSSNAWQQTFENLPATDASGDIAYGVRVAAQSNVPSGYAASPTQADTAGTAFTIKYSPAPSPTPVTVATTATPSATPVATAVKTAGTPNTGDASLAAISAGVVAIIGLAWIGGSQLIRMRDEF